MIGPDANCAFQTPAERSAREGRQHRPPSAARPDRASVAIRATAARVKVSERPRGTRTVATLQIDQRAESTAITIPSMAHLPSDVGPVSASRGKGPPRLSAGIKTAGFHKPSTPGTLSLTCGRLFGHRLLARQPAIPGHSPSGAPPHAVVRHPSDHPRRPGPAGSSPKPLLQSATARPGLSPPSPASIQLLSPADSAIRVPRGRRVSPSGLDGARRNLPQERRKQNVGRSFSKGPLLS
jgi:hypothetical protein